MLTGKARAT